MDIIMSIAAILYLMYARYSSWNGAFVIARLRSPLPVVYAPVRSVLADLCLYIQLVFCLSLYMPQVLPETLGWCTRILE